MTQKTAYNHNATVAATDELARNSNIARRCSNSAMTHAAETPPIRSTEALSVYSPSIIPILFSRLNGALAVAIAAERDLDHGNGRDPAIDHWLREAERAWSGVNEIVKALHEAPLTRAEDRPLVTMAGIADAIMNSAAMSELGSAHNRLRATTFFRRHLRRDVPNRISKMLDQCHAHLLEVAELDLYQPVCDPEHLPYGFSDAWPEAC